MQADLDGRTPVQAGRVGEIHTWKNTHAKFFYSRQASSDIEVPSRAAGIRGSRPHLGRLSVCRRLLIVLAAVTLAGCGDEPAAGAPESRRADGPLDSGSRTGAAQPVDRRHKFAFGWIVLRNRSRTDAVLERVRLVRRSAGLHVHRVYAAGERRGVEYVGTSRRWPPPEIDLEAFKRVRGFVVRGRDTEVTEPVAGTAITVVMTARRRGRLGFEGVAIDYRVGKRRYREVFPHFFYACVETRRRCSAPLRVREGS